MKKLSIITMTLFLIIFSFCRLASADFEIIQPHEGAYYLSNSEIFLSTDSVSMDAYSGIRWYYNGKKVTSTGANYIVMLDSADLWNVETGVVKAVYGGQAKKVTFKTYNEPVIQKAVSFLKGTQSSDGSFGGYTGHYYIASVLGNAGVDINVPKQDKTTYLEYLSSLDIDEESTAGELAKLVYTLAGMKKNVSDFYGRNIAKLLLDKQKSNGTFGEGVYTDVLAITALDKAGVEIPKKDELIIYFEGLSYKNGLFEDWGFTDIDTTARIVRSLKILGCDTQYPIIKNAIDAINNAQTDSGAIEAWGEPNCDTTAEVVLMLLDLNINPTEGSWNKNGKNLISVMLENQNPDGSFKSGFDIKYSTYEELSALAEYYFKYLTPLTEGNNHSGDSSGSNEEENNPGNITVNVSVTGKLDSMIYPVKKITIEENAKYGKTALQALYQTGLDFKTKNDDAYVSEINGIKEDISSTAGWKYKVNGKIPGVSAKNYKLGNNDSVIWFWAESADSDSSYQTEQEEENTPMPAMLQNQEQSVSQVVYSFSDVSGGCFDWALKEIEYLASKRLVQGNGLGKFQPGIEVTREEAVKMIVLAMGEILESDKNLDFRDSGEISTWAVPYISKAKKIGIINGFEDNTFKPKQRISRIEMAIMISRALAFKNIECQISEKVQLSDWRSIPQWAEEGIEKIVNLGIIKGKNGQFAGEDLCIRAEAAVMIYRMIMLFASL